jgi:type VI secretion system secreted protein VgrG
MSTATYKQADRVLEITTPLGEDVLLLTAFVGHEEMSRMFRFELYLVSEKDSISAKDIVGKNVTFSLRKPDGGLRHFNGFVSRFVSSGRGDRLSTYRAEVVPWFWFLTRTSDCRIFQNMTIVQIVEKVFKDLGFSDFDTSGVKGEHPTWDYCVQYRETDANFVSRLLEQEGMFFFFKHEKGKHTLVIADDKGAHKDCEDSQVEFAASLSAPMGEDFITRWEHQYEFRPGKWAHTDYNFETPTTRLMANTNSVVNMDGMDKFEIYDYPGEYEKKNEGDAEVKLRMEEEEAAHEVVSGSSKCRSFSPGGKFTLKKHHVKSESGKPYVLTSVHHSAKMAGSYITGYGEKEHDYQNHFTCIPASATFRAARITPKPLIQGSQTAVVVGPGGEEIYPDKYGRVKVQFHWDREGKKDEKSSCWIRCAQPIAGKSWGAIFIPRIGQEVVVSFLEGDPDRPLITGVVYNAENMPPYGLPENKTQSGFKSRSSKGGGGDDFNELRFEDKKGEEQVYFHAQKDFKRHVEHDDELKVENHQEITIHGNRTEKVETGNEKVTIQQGNREIVVSLGNDKHKIDLGSQETEAMQSITLKVGMSSLTIDQMGVTIKGGMVTVQGQMMTEVKAPMTTVSGTGMLALKGGILMIN